MMHLRSLAKGKWTVVAEVDNRGSCAVQAELDALANSAETKATAAGFRAQFDTIPVEGPSRLPDVIYHCVDANEAIYEFTKRNHRILCFTAAGRVVVCATVFLKQGRKVPPAEVKKAVALKKRYLAALQNDLVTYD